LLKLSGTKFFLYPAQFWEHKCHKTLIAAASRLKAAGVSDFRVVFTGSYADSYRAKNYLYLRKLAAHLNVDDLIVFLGFVEKSELDYLYRNALCLLMPTAFGPSNLPPLEALARTCPVIASNAYGMKQFLPFSVPLLDFNDPELWANEMAKFLNNIDYKSAVYREQSKNLEIRSQNRALKQLSQVIEALLND
jgi:glycosyltransferase involved in cell wall biosynthesis